MGGVAFVAGVIFGWLALAVLVALAIGAVIAAADKAEDTQDEDDTDEVENYISRSWDVSA